MKKIIMFLLVFLIGIVVTGNTEGVNASSPNYNPDLMLLSITDVEIATEVADGDNALFVETLSQMGYDNYEAGSSSYVDEGYTIFGKNLTVDEINLLIANPLVALDWVYCGLTAETKTASLYTNANDGTIANSFQHAYWNVLMVKHLGYELAEDFATAHENYEGNPWIHKSMDLYNNEQGRDYADTISWLWLKSANRLATMTQDLVTDGNLRYILWNYQYISAYIYYDGGVIEPVYDNGDFHSYTDGATPIYLPEIEIIDRRSKPGPIIMPMSIVPDEEEIIYVEEGTLE